MVTLTDLKQEDCWNDEVIPQSLAELRTELLLRYHWEPWRVGIIGDEHHLYGAHRSRRWILESKFCTNRHYTVTETEGNRHGGNENHVAGMDIIVNQALAQALVARVKAAQAAGHLGYVRQCYVEFRPSHVHLTFDRGMLHLRMNDLLATLTGAVDPGVKMVKFTVTMPQLQQSSEGDVVKTAQSLLNVRGFPTTIDGDFGPQTDANTRAMQRKFGAEVIDGIWGPETWTIGLSGEDQN